MGQLEWVMLPVNAKEIVKEMSNLYQREKVINIKSENSCQQTLKRTSRPVMLVEKKVAWNKTALRKLWRTKKARVSSRVTVMLMLIMPIIWMNDKMQEKDQWDERTKAQVEKLELRFFSWLLIC